MRAARQANCKDRALAGLARHRHVAAHHACELARDGKAETCAAVAPRGRGICLGEFLEQLRLLFGVRPMPVSATASSTQSRPSATLRTRRATSPSFVNLQALLNRLSRICRSRMGSRVERAEVLLRFDDEAVLVLLGELSRSADNLVNQRWQIAQSRD